MKTSPSIYLRLGHKTILFCLLSIMWIGQLAAQNVCQTDTSFTDILFVIDNSGSIDDTEYDQFSDIIMATIQNVQRRCRSSQIGVMHYGGAFGLETFVEYNFSRINQINQVKRQYCTTRNQFNNCSEGGGDDLNAAMGDALDMIQNGTLNRNPINKLAIVIFTDAFGFEENCSFINCSVIRPFTNIDQLKSQYNAQVTVVGASMQAEASLLALYASPGGTFDNVRLFEPDCPSTFDGCALPRKYIPIEFNSPIGPSSDSIAVCVNCSVEIIGGVTADAGPDQTLCEEEDVPATLSAELSNGTAPFTFFWDQGLGAGNDFQVSPIVTTTYTVTVTDANGCSDVDAVTIVVENCIPDCGAPPIIICPQDTVVCPGSDISSAVLGMATASPGDPNCPKPTITMKDSLADDGSCLQTIFRMWTATYNVDNTTLTSSCVQVIRLEDTTAPEIEGLPQDINVDSDVSCQSAVTWEAPTATDDCGVEELQASAMSGALFDLGTTYVLYTAIDFCGNITRDSFGVTVTQQCCLEGPIINCPPDYHGCPTAAVDPMMTGMASASMHSNLCGAPDVSFSDQVEQVGTCVGQRIITRTWTAIDSERPELVSSCIQMLYLLDTVPPSLSQCPMDVTIDPDNPIHEWEDPIVDENCGFSLSYNIPSGSTFPTGDTRVVAIATDMCGNQDSCSFIVTVPEEVQITCPDMPVFRCMDTLLMEMIPDAMTTTTCALCETEDDDCVETSVVIDSVYRDGDRTIYEITYSAVDLCGTDNECSTQVVVDNSSSIECPDDIVVVAPPHGFDYVSWETPIFNTCCTICKTRQIPGFLYMGQLGDSYYYCSYARVNWNKAERIAQENEGHLVTINSLEENDFIARRLVERHAYIGLTDSEDEGTFLWTSGEASEYRQWKRGQPDNEGNEDFVEMDAQGYWYDVDGREKREFVMEIKGCDHVTQIGGPASGSKFRVGTTTVTYSAEDGCGNTDECSFNVIMMPYVLQEPTLSNIFNPSEEILSITPNPAATTLYIKSETEIERIEVYGINGQLRAATTFKKYKVGQLDVSEYPSGLHIIKVTMADGSVMIRKTVIE